MAEAKHPEEKEKDARPEKTPKEAGPEKTGEQTAPDQAPEKTQKRTVKKLKHLTPEQQKAVEIFVDLIRQQVISVQKKPSADLTGHPSFGAWAGREDIQDTETFARALRRRASHRRHD